MRQTTHFGLTTTKNEMYKNLIKTLFARSHLWAIKKRFPTWTDLLVPLCEEDVAVDEDTIDPEVQVVLDPDASVRLDPEPTTSSEEAPAKKVQSWQSTNKWVQVKNVHIDNVNPMSQVFKIPFTATQVK